MARQDPQPIFQGRSGPFENHADACQVEIMSPEFNQNITRSDSLQRQHIHSILSKHSVDIEQKKTMFQKMYQYLQVNCTSCAQTIAANKDVNLSRIERNENRLAQSPIRAGRGAND